MMVTTHDSSVGTVVNRRKRKDKDSFILGVEGVASQVVAEERGAKEV